MENKAQKYVGEDVPTFYCADSCDNCGEIMEGETCPKDAYNLRGKKIREKLGL